MSDRAGMPGEFDADLSREPDALDALVAGQPGGEECRHYPDDGQVIAWRMTGHTKAIILQALRVAARVADQTCEHGLADEYHDVAEIVTEAGTIPEETP